MQPTVPTNIARNLRQIRKRRGLTQSQLAKLCGMPRPTLAYLESGEANPTVAVLLKAATALQISLEELITSPKHDCRHYPAAELKHTRRGEAVLRKLLPDPLPGVDFDRIELPAKARMAGVPHRAGTREYLTCERGRIELSVAGERFTLDPGDVVVFRGDQRHAYANPGPTTSVGYSVVLISR